VRVVVDPVGHVLSRLPAEALKGTVADDGVDEKTVVLSQDLPHARIKVRLVVHERREARRVARTTEEPLQIAPVGAGGDVFDEKQPTGSQVPPVPTRGPEARELQQISSLAVLRRQILTTTTEASPAGPVGNGRRRR
jgi:hypothetical protein